MNRSIQDALIFVSSFWQAIIAVSIAQVILISGLPGPVRALFGIASILIFAIVYGRMVARMVPGRTVDSWGILKEHGVNYLITGLILGVPILALRLWATSLAPSFFSSFVLSIGLKIAVATLTVYVWPLVFLNRASLSSVVTGIVFLSRNLVASAWIVGVTFAAQLLHMGGWLALRAQSSPWTMAPVSST